MLAYFLSKLVTVFCGMLYPAYCSYKAVKTKDVKEYVHWMMHWIVFSIFSVTEVFADTLVGLWFPFYYELKIWFMIWLFSPSTRGGSSLYRRWVHPFFTRHEPEIDGYLAQFKLRISNMIVQWGSKAFSYVTEVVTSAVLRGGGMSGGDIRVMNTKVTRTYSYENFDQPDMNRNSYPPISPPADMDSRVELLSDLDNSFDEQRQAHGRQRNLYSRGTRYDSVDEQLGRMPEMSTKASFSMMDLTDGVNREDSLPPPKVRASTRKKKEYGNVLTTALPAANNQQQATFGMPVVFWGPPDMNSRRIMSTPFSPQEFSRFQFHGASSRESFIQYLQEDYSSSLSLVVTDDEEESENDSDNFFDCDSGDNYNSQKDRDGRGRAPLSPKVHVVSKTVLKEFDSESSPPTVVMRTKNRSDRNSSSSSTDKNRSSTSSLHSVDIDKQQLQQQQQNVKVKKSTSQHDFKLVKAPILSTSSFSRVFSPFSPTPTSVKKGSSPDPSGNRHSKT